MSDQPAPRIAPWFAAAAAVLIADQATKHAVLQSSIIDQPVVLAPFLQLVYVENTGAAFSFLADRGEWARWLLTAFATGISAVVIWWMMRRPPPLESAALSLILGGALGNLVDRIRYGYVVDFIDAHWNNWHWPAFNIADSAITAGAFLLLWMIVTEKK